MKNMQINFALRICAKQWDSNYVDLYTAFSLASLQQHNAMFGFMCHNQGMFIFHLVFLQRKLTGHKVAYLHTQTANFNT